MKDRGNGMKSIAMVMIFIFAGLTTSGVQAEIYSWNDENGVKHYSNTPPADQSVHIKTAPEIQSESTTDQEIEKLNEENIDAVLEALEREERASAPEPSKTPKPLSRPERIASEKEKLEEKITWLEQLPPEAYANARSKQAIIGRYRYRLELLESNSDEYFKNYGN
jgi:hypothetical protein